MTGAPQRQPYRGALPRPTPETKPFWDGAKQHKLMLPWCKACGRAHFFPRNCCPHCFVFDLEWRQASGRGKLHTYVINHKPARGFEDKVPYVIAVVELEEGPRMMSNIVMDEAPTPENLLIDMDLEVCFDDVTADMTLPKFRLAGRAQP
jgi:uncharacterized OB-fold protein